MSDPLQTLWDALEARDCRPRGKAHDFRARCPAHDGENRDALRVSLGADGRALVWCFAHQCDAEAITAALGLSLQNLFPPGHHRARRLPSLPVKRSDFRGPAHSVANVLFALERIEAPWWLMLASDCPYCGLQGAYLRALSPGSVLPNGMRTDQGRVDFDCPDGCSPDNYVQALLAAAKGVAA